MKVSVIIPCHNAEEYVGQAIRALWAQNHRPHEIIVVDDASTDHSCAVVNQLIQTSAMPLSLHAQSFRNACRSRQFGADRADGQALMFLDADDLLDPDALAGMVEALAAADATNALALGRWQRLAWCDDAWRAEAASCPARHRHEPEAAAWLRGWYHPPCAVLWRREAFDSTGGWDPLATVNNDGDIMLRALLNNSVVRYAVRGCSFYRRPLMDGQSLSGRRQTQDGLRGRMWVLGKVVHRVELDAALGDVIGALDGAMTVLAQDARANAPMLREEIALLQQRVSYLNQRVIGHIRVCGEADSVADQPPYAPGSVINFGVNETLVSEPTASLTGQLNTAVADSLPLVSVIIPSFNRAIATLAAVRSVQQQTEIRTEILVVDDASTDVTASLISEAGKEDQRIRLLVQLRNKGVAAARNRGMRQARGQFLAFLDCDDLWKPDKLAMQLAFFKNAPADVGLVYTGVERRDGERVELHYPSSRGRILQELLLENVVYGGGSNVMIRREVLAAVGFFDQTLPAAEDHEYWIRIATFFAIDFVDQPLLIYNDQGCDASRRSRAVAANLAGRIALVDKHVVVLRRSGLLAAALCSVARRCISPWHRDLPAARRLAWRAWRAAPLQKRTVGLLKWVAFESLRLPRAVDAPPREAVS